MRWGEEVCEGRIQPRQCAACSLHADGFPQAVSQLLACSPLSASRWPDGPWIPRLARRSLLQGKRNSFSEFMNGAAQVIACASWCRDVLLRNGVSPERVQVRRQALPGRSRTVRLKFPQKKSIKIGFIGRFTWVKGPDLFLRALQELRQRGIDARGSLIGPIAQNEREWAESLLRRYAENAVYDGVKQGEELDSWLRSLDLVLVPSRCLETGPLTVLEAWDAGLPVVGANLGGIAEFLRDAGMESLLFTANDATAAAQAVIRATRWKGDVKTEVRGMAELAQSMADVYSDVCSRGKPIAA